ncbi:MAG: leucine-rich repeat protein, partial [Paludibacteraceae bacterium]|nr:leucine-rich repeat protein [Paludibacteraceae bacterium]
VTPQLKIEGGYWYISYNNGATWTKLGKATGEDGEDGAKGDKGDTGATGATGPKGEQGDSMFKSVTQDENYVYFTLADGTVIKIAKGNGNGQPNADDIIEFTDFNVRLALVELGVDTNKDGEISYAEAENVTRLDFSSHKFTSFREFKYFTNLQAISFFNTGVRELVFPANGVDSILDNAFEGTLLKNLTIPEGTKYVGAKAFYKCSTLVSICIPNSITTLGNDIFRDCFSLSSVNIPNSITSISSGMFYGCSSLGSIDIPNNIITIDEDAFNGCISLSAINMSNSVVKIGDHAFSGCKTFVYPEKLSFTYPTYFYTPSSLTSVYWNTTNYSSLDNGLAGTSWRKGIIFATTGAYDNYSIKKVVIGDKVQHIPDVMCYGLKSLTEITIPSSVTSIGYNPFDNCSNLKHIYCKASTPPTSSSTLYFPNSVIAIYVPAASLGDYLTSWSDYADKIIGYDFK